MKFGYTILYVKDVASTVAFYEKAFGFERQFVHDSGHYAEMGTGATTLGFASHGLARGKGTPFVADLPPGQSPAMEVCFVTDDVSAAFRKAVGAGAEPLAEPKQKPWGQTVSYVRDNNGFLVELCTPVSRPPGPSTSE